MRQITSMLVFAIAALVMTLVVLLPARLNATEPSMSGEIAHPKLEIDGASLYVQPVVPGSTQADGTIEAGEPLALELVAMNSTDHAITISPTVALSVSRFTSPLSRTMSLPSESWRVTPTIALSPGQTMTVKLLQEVKLDAGFTGTVMLRTQKSSIVAMRLQVALTAAR